jgi:hypothetical protein
VDSVLIHLLTEHKGKKTKLDIFKLYPFSLINVVKTMYFYKMELL